ncbi:MAG: endo-1,4-beta-xylanase [Bacteroidales bacterium]|nr:endo-1,4-beta-xylanase [Bacteroidales bacterium]MBQ3976914.1 endo-1,4-beta-xylanase [Bacteroidales bacterium]
MKKYSILALIASVVMMSACGPKDPGLKDAYKKYFKIGVAVTERNVTDSLISSIILKEYNSITAENCMKPGELHPEAGVWNFEKADIIANFCREHGIKMRGHNLVWHSQFATWMFTKHDENGNPVVELDEKGDTVWVERPAFGRFRPGQRPAGAPGAPGGAPQIEMTKVPKYVAASKQEFYDSLKVHIQTVVNRYKDVIYCWDVVNEAMSDANNPDAPYEDSFRKSQAYQLCGDEFIKNAFIWAHEADPNCGLFYNDYSAWTPAKRTYIYNMVKKLQSEGAPITGIGMQGHYNIFDNPTLEDFETAINMYLELVDDIQITEFDIRINEEAGGGLQFSRGEGQQYTEEIQKQQEKKYKDLFEIMRKYSKNISCVTFWNVSDRDSWLGANNYPLLYDSNYQRKPVYYVVRDFKKNK